MMKKSKKNKISPNAEYYFKPKGLDTVVFVHGLKGHFKTTWGKFPLLLYSDFNLPPLDILMWGYKTSVLFKSVHDTKILGRHFTSSLGAQIEPDNAIHLVGHSMGGLVILEGLVQEMIGQRAQHHPAQAVDFISLFASPVSGSIFCSFMKNTIGWTFGIRKLFSSQLRSLATGKDCEMLVLETIHRIYKPPVNDSSSRQIPIRLIMATKDIAVRYLDSDTTYAKFRIPPPREYDFGHSEIKLPTSHLDDRYKVLSNDIQTNLAVRFKLLSIALSSTDLARINTAKNEYSKRYMRFFYKYFNTFFGNSITYKDVYKGYVRLVIFTASQSEPPLPPFHIANSVIQRLKGIGTS